MLRLGEEGAGLFRLATIGLYVPGRPCLGFGPGFA